MQPRRLGTRSIRRTIYSLKRTFGFPIVIYKIIDSALDLETGNKLNTFRFKRVQRAPILPTKYVRRFVTAAKDGTPRGLFDAGVKWILIDWQDLRDFEITIDAIISYDGANYLISEVHEFELKTAYVVKAQEIVGDTFISPSDQTVIDTITFTQTVSEVVE